MNGLIKTEKGDLIPVKSMPEELRSKKVLELGVWLSKLLSLKDETSMERLEVLLPMVSDYCWSMSIEDIRKAFIKYVKGELSGVEPRTNFLDVILFGKIIKSYKEQRIVKKAVVDKMEISEEEKKHNEYLNIVYAYDEWKQSGKVSLDYHYVYDSLKTRKLISTDEETSKQLNEYLREQYPHFTREKKQKKGKCILLERFFERCKVHIKNLLI